jgi:hypothetical protein
MAGKISVNYETVEAMLYYWHSMKDREKVPEKFIYEIAEMPGLKGAYDEEFDGESVRRALSAIKNREVFSSRTKKEARFWNNNLWMMEDLSYTDEMVQPIKKLNLDDAAESGGDIEVIFAPLHFDDYVVNGNRLIINFFKIKPGNGAAYINEVELKTFIRSKMAELR